MKRPFQPEPSAASLTSPGSWAAATQQSWGEHVPRCAGRRHSSPGRSHKHTCQAGGVLGPEELGGPEPGGAGPAPATEGALLRVSPGRCRECSPGFISSDFFPGETGHQAIAVRCTILKCEQLYTHTHMCTCVCVCISFILMSFFTPGELNRIRFLVSWFPGCICSLGSQLPLD